MLRVGIVGGGVSGLAAAVALRSVGHAPEVFERAPQIQEVGSGLTLWANATRVLRELGALDACLERSHRIDDFHLQHASGRMLMRIPIEAFATHAVAMHRADLQAALVRRLPAGVVMTQQQCLGIREDASGVYLQLATGERGPFDVVLGADGVRSCIRSYVRGADEPLSYRGYTIWRGVAQMDALQPVQSAISETWGLGHRFGILPLGGGRVCWYATANARQPKTTRPEDRQATILAMVDGWHDPVQSLVAATPSEAILEHATYDRVVRAGWSRGAVALVGDAAHPLTPNLGQGACLALEDAVVLGRLLIGVQGREAVHGALRRFEQMRLPRVRAMARRCRWLGALGQWEDPRANFLRLQAVKVIPGALFTRTSRAIQSFAADQVAPFRPL
jgi:2-polyprenyl-6-methoxyphenol hydroxylase-like FAD-dependent oxidoreductase